MTLGIPTAWGMVFALFFQALFLAFFFTLFLSGLRKDYGPRPAAAVLLAGTVAGVAVGLTAVLLGDNRVFVSHCRTFEKSELPDVVLIVAGFFQGSGLFSAGGAGMVLAWLGARYWRRGIRPDKTTTLIVGLLVGLGVGAIVELARVRWGDARGVNPARLSLFTFLGGLLFLVSRPFLFHGGRFQFGIKHLLGLTVVWALVFGWLGPQLSRYQAETETLASLAKLLGGPIQCERHEGFTGLEYVGVRAIAPMHDCGHSNRRGHRPTETSSGAFSVAHRTSHYKRARAETTRGRPAERPFRQVFFD